MLALERRIAPAMACSRRTAAGPGTPTASKSAQMRWKAASPASEAGAVGVTESPPGPKEGSMQAASAFIIPLSPSASMPAGLESASLCICMCLCMRLSGL